MPRRRMISPDFWKDEDIRKLRRDERLLFIGCISYADDEGRLLAHPAYLKAMIFMYDEDLESGEIKKLRDGMLSKLRNLIKYEVAGEEYMAFLKWKKHQKPNRPTPSNIPAPELNEPLPEPLSEQSSEPITESISDKVNDSVSESPDASIGKVSIGKVSIGIPPVVPLKGPYSYFKTFWQAYPKKVAKQDAEKAFYSVFKVTGKHGSETVEELMSKIMASLAYNSKSQDWLKDNGKFIPYAATWLRGRRWEDEIPANGGTGQKSTTGRMPTKYTKPEDL